MSKAWTCFVGMFAVAACAMGDIPRAGGQDASVRHDARFATGDAPVPHDAAGGVRDATSATPDAGSALFCTVNSDCSASTDCCFFAVCVPGDRIGDNLCFPH
jgi:hypothetical protein